jgi:phytoene synthase
MQLNILNLKKDFMSIEETQFELSQRAIQHGSKSFRLASLFLDSEAQRGAYLLYRWCRHCDDVIDEGHDPLEGLKSLQQETQSSLQKNDLGSSEDHSDLSAFSGLQELNLKFKVPHHLFFELLEGFRMDVEKVPLNTYEDLLKYCYHVAGVVGLMMNPILQNSLPEVNPLSQELADSLGRAMQLTNISRDIAEDFKMGRVYIPQNWLEQNQIPKDKILEPEFAEATFARVEELLAKADELYLKGRKGLMYLPLRAAWSISVASYLYQGIGHKVRRRRLKSFASRTVLNPLEKLFYVGKGSLNFFIDRLYFNFKKMFSKERF